MSVPISGANLTPDEISEQLIQNTPDAFAAACNQIVALDDANHKLIASQRALVAINIHILPLVDELRDFIVTYAPIEASAKLDHIKAFSKAGSKFK